MKLKNILIIATATCALAFLTGCKKNTEPHDAPNPPIINTNPVTNIGSASVVSGGIISNATNITDKGIVWGTDSSALTITAPDKISDGAGESGFTDTIHNLKPNTSYYIRAYAVYSTGVAYGRIIKFTTLPPQPTVYIAGFIGSNAVYWKNDSIIYLPRSDAYDAWAHSIYVVGNDVYVAGIENTVGLKSRAVYWKNGKEVRLTDGSKAAYAFSIFVSGNDVYVAGYETVDDRYPVAKYWKNGVAVSLSGGTSIDNGNASSIYVVGSDVYVAGTKSNEYLGSEYAVYWKNGIAFPLSDSINHIGYAQSIFVKDNDVYVAGNEKPRALSSRVVSKYWKNGTAVILTDGSKASSANCIYVNSSNDVYVAGFEDDGSTGYSVAKYWKNGEAFPLTDATRFASADCIYVKGADVYVGITEQFTSHQSYFQAKYWKNGTFMPLFPETEGSSASSIFVQ